MAEAKTEAVRLLLQNPYRQVLLQDYHKTLENRKFRKRMEEIDNEISWFNGKKNQYRVEDRQGFFRHFQEHYVGKKYPAMGPMYRALSTYHFGEEPEIVYFMMLYVKKDQELREIREQYPDMKELQSNDVQRIRSLKLRNECRLLSALLARLDGNVGAVCAGIAEIFTTDYTRNLDKLGLPVLQSRFYRSLRSADPAQTFAVLEQLKKIGAPDIPYMEALANFNARDYQKALELTERFPQEDKNYQRIQVMRTECHAKLGNVQGFIDAFRAVGGDIIDTIQFLYLLQELLTHAPYSELDNDEFDTTVQELLKSKFRQTDDSVYTGVVSRNFVDYLTEGLPIAAELVRISSQGGEDSLPQDRLSRLYQLQMALDLYPNEDISSLIDMDTVKEKGVKYCQEKIGRLAMTLLLEKSKEKSFDNIYAAFIALRKMELYKAFVSNVENNVAALCQYGKGGQNRAFELIRSALQIKQQQGEDVFVLENAMREAGVTL